jgi:hypothetical protein
MTIHWQNAFAGNGRRIDFDDVARQQLETELRTAGEAYDADLARATSAAASASNAFTNALAAWKRSTGAIHAACDMACRFAESVTTTIAAASDGFALPQATIHVADATAFPSFGTAVVVTSNGPQPVAFGGTTGTTLAGCSGGTGTMSTGGAVQFISSTRIDFDEGSTVADAAMMGRLNAAIAAASVPLASLLNRYKSALIAAYAAKPTLASTTPADAALATTLQTKLDEVAAYVALAAYAGAHP